MDERCENCKFFPRGALKCRRHAPTVIQLKGYFESQYPTTFDGDWCGDWELNQNIKLEETIENS